MVYELEKEHKKSSHMSKKKEELVKEVMRLEHNVNVMNERLNNQANAIKRYEKEARKNAIDEFAERLKGKAEEILKNPDIVAECKKCTIWTVRDIDEIAEEMRGAELLEVEAIHKVVSSAKHSGGWIPCSERLPELGKRYLVSVIWEDEWHNYRKPAVYDAVFGGDGLWHTNNYEPTPYEVIAWRELPEPYKPEGE